MLLWNALPRGRERASRIYRRALAAALVLAATAWAGPVWAEIVFLEDGRVIQADRVEVRGDRVQIENQGMSLSVPAREVITIHPTPPPGGTPPRAAPADTYRDLPQQMNERIRQEIQGK